MTLFGAKSHATKTTNSAFLDYAYNCIITINPAEILENGTVWSYKVSKKTKINDIKSSIKINATSRGQASLKALTEVIKSVDGSNLKCFSICTNSDYAVSTFNNIFSRDLKKIADTSLNMNEIYALREVCQTVGSRYNIVVKKELIYRDNITDRG